MKEKTTRLLTILGPTAAGKTAFAAHLAHHLDGEVLSADSRQVYRGMDIGTGKDYEDYIVDGEQVAVHLIDILDAGEEYNVYLFKQDFIRSLADISEREKLPVLCGGSGLYIESVLKNYRLLQVPPDKALRAELEEKDLVELEGRLKSYGPLHNRTDTTSKKRIIRAIEIAMFQSGDKAAPVAEVDLDPLVIGVHLERNARRARITARLKRRLEEGMVEEVEALIDAGVSPEMLDYYGLEYRYISRYLLKEMNYDEMVERLNTAIHQFSKRQMTYFRGMEKRGARIHWVDGAKPLEQMCTEALEICSANGIARADPE